MQGQGIGECDQERGYWVSELLSLGRLPRLCTEGAPQEKGAEGLPHRKVQIQEQP